MSGRQSRTLAFPDFADCFCARMPNRLPDRYPVTPRHELARRIPIVVATRGNERLLCTMEHDGPHAWPVLELLEPLPDPYANAPDPADAVVFRTVAPAEDSDPELAVVADDVAAHAPDDADSSAQDADADQAVDLVSEPANDTAPAQEDLLSADDVVAPMDTAPAADEVAVDRVGVDAPVQSQVDTEEASLPVADVVAEDAVADVEGLAADLPESELDASLVEPVDLPDDDAGGTDDAPSAAVPGDTASLVEEFFADTADDAAEAQSQDLPGDASVEDCAPDAPANVTTDAALPEVVAADDPVIPYKVDVPDDVADTATDAIALSAPDEDASDVQHAADDAELAADVGTADMTDDDADPEHTQDDERADGGNPRSQEPPGGASV